MSLFLLILGAVTAAAGFGLVALGVSIQDHVFDTAVLTPGVVAVVGGFFLVGLGLAVRVLQQIEATLAARPKPRSAETAQGELRREASAASQPVTQPEMTTPLAAPAAAQDAASARLREKFPTLVRTVEAVEEIDMSLPRAAAAPVDEDIAQEELGQEELGREELGREEFGREKFSREKFSKVRRAAATAGSPQRRSNGLVVVPTSRRPQSAPAASQREQAKNSMFDAFWPKNMPAGRAARAVPASEPMPEAEFEAGVEPSAADNPATAEPPAHNGPAVLKSGVVDGMAYTLYADGSIEAQLPQGLVRFGSITELRNHIEQSS